MNNDVYIKGKIDSNISEVFKKILSELNMTQQDFVDRKVKDFIIENIHLIIKNDEKKSDK